MRRFFYRLLQGAVLLALFGAGPGQAADELPPAPRFPATPFVVDVKRPPYSARGDGVTDDTEALQRALNENVGQHRLLYFPAGEYLVSRTLTWPKKWADHEWHGSAADFRLEDGTSPVVEFAHFGYVGGGLEINTCRTLILRSVSDVSLKLTARAKGGDLFLEDCVTSALDCRGQNVWARQLNIENEGDHLINAGGNLWVLGYKTERGGTLLSSREGARSELLGNFSYTTTAGKLAPMFQTEAAAVFAFFGEVCFNGDPFAVLIRETRGGITREIQRGEGATTPYGTGLAEQLRSRRARNAPERLRDKTGGEGEHPGPVKLQH